MTSAITAVAASHPTKAQLLRSFSVVYRVGLMTVIRIAVIPAPIAAGKKV